MEIGPKRSSVTGFCVSVEGALELAKSGGGGKERCSARGRAAEPATTPTTITAMARRMILIQRFLELLAGAEARLLGRLDGDFLAGLRIAAFAAGAGGDHKD